MARFRMNTDAFTERAYEMLPKVYKELDSKIGYPLKRYMKSIADSAVASLIEESNGILDLNDPDNTPSSVLPVLYKQYGMTIFHGLPEYYIRKLLPLMGDIYARKGSMSALEYLASVLSEVTAEVIVSDDFENDRHIDLVLEMDYDGETHGIPDKDQMAKLVKEFVPFFINTTVIYLYSFYDTVRLKVIEWWHDRVTETTGEECSIIPAYETDNRFFRVGHFRDDLVFGDKKLWLIDVDYTKDHITDTRYDTPTLEVTEEQLPTFTTDSKEESVNVGFTENLLDNVHHKAENDTVGFAYLSSKESRFFNGLLFGDMMMFGYEKTWEADWHKDIFIYTDSDIMGLSSVLDVTPFFRSGRVFNQDLTFGAFESEVDTVVDRIYESESVSTSVTEAQSLTVQTSPTEDAVSATVTDSVVSRVKPSIILDNIGLNDTELADTQIALFLGVAFSTFSVFRFGVPEVEDTITYRNGVTTTGYPTSHGYVCADL